MAYGEGGAERRGPEDYLVVEDQRVQVGFYIPRILRETLDTVIPQVEEAGGGKTSRTELMTAILALACVQLDGDSANAALHRYRTMHASEISHE